MDGGVPAGGGHVASTGPAGNPARLLVVDDEQYLADAVTMGLVHAGFLVRQANDGRTALELTGSFHPDLLVLDVMLPDMDGFAVCNWLRATGNEVPVLFLTARDSTEDTIAGLGAGGDDYLTKPFVVAELIARIEAVLRRTRSARAEAGSRRRYADLTMDVRAREVWRGEVFVELTATEFDLLLVLVEHAGQVLSRAQLLDAVWSYDFGGNPNILETYVSYLRRKLDASGPPLIQTVRGVGYSLRLPRVPPR
jgi:two-component system OmpR family response regulator